MEWLLFKMETKKNKEIEIELLIKCKAKLIEHSDDYELLLPFRSLPATSLRTCKVFLVS
jgi:hypothetical protein